MKARLAGVLFFVVVVVIISQLMFAQLPGGGVAEAAIAQQDNRDQRMPAEKVMNAIGLKEGMVVGEAGAGDGYFTFKMIKRVGKSGKIYANDISRRSLDRLASRAKREGYTNIETVMGEVADARFPVKVDIVVVVWAFHDFSEPVAWLENLKQYLKPGAKVAIIDGDPAKLGSAHNWPREKVINYHEKAGYKLVDIFDDFLPKEMILIFELK